MSQDEHRASTSSSSSRDYLDGNQIETHYGNAYHSDSKVGEMDKQVDGNIDDYEQEILPDAYNQESRLASFIMLQDSVKLKALKQLELSEDSPFSYLNSKGSSNIQPSRANDIPANHHDLIKLLEAKQCETHLQRETKQIREQLDMVKRSLSELKLSAVQDDQNKRFGASEDKSEQKNAPNNQKEDEINGTSTKNLQTSAQIKDKKTLHSEQVPIPKPRTIVPGSKYRQNITKFRPLTGKTDCPNCLCDRSSSICVSCNKMKNKTNHNKSNGSSFNNNIRSNSMMRNNSAHETINKPKYIDNYDERPIRPAQNHNFKPTFEATRNETTVNQVVVPNRVYTISKSLDDKRTKLAKAIEDLQLMIDKVGARGERLEEERKIVQLYKDQWKFGPKIGGPTVSSRDRRGLVGGASVRSTNSEANSLASKRNYISRLDPNLARDSQSLVGYQNISSTMKTKQYDATRIAKTRPTSKISAANTTWRAPWNTKLRGTPRSKSFESLKFTPRKPKPRIYNELRKSQTDSNQHMTDKRDSVTQSIALNKRKSSSDINLSQLEDDSSLQVNEIAEDDEQIVEMIVVDDDITKLDDEAQENDEHDTVAKDDLEVEMIVDSDEQEQQKQAEQKLKQPRKQDDNKQNLSKLSKSVSTSSNDGYNTAMNRAKTPIQRMTWVPVYGETEIKILKPTTKRKVTIFEPNKSISSSSSGKTNVVASLPSSTMTKKSQTSTTTMRPAILKSSIFSNTNHRTMIEAKKVLNDATNLLKNEELDSKTKNKLTIVDHTTIAKTRSTTSNLPSTNSRNSIRSETARGGLAGSQHNSHPKGEIETTQRAKSLVLGANKEIARLEEMIQEQKEILLRIAEQSRRQIADNRLSAPPITLRCSSPCHDHTIETNCVSVRTAPSFSRAATQRPGSPTSLSSGQDLHHATDRDGNLVHILRDKLNKTKARLSKILGEEREKHHQLKERFDSTLKKQSDLEHENELLKKSLSKCIDTCLQDISSTFESINETLISSLISPQKDRTSRDHVGELRRAVSSDLTRQQTSNGTFSHSTTSTTDNSDLLENAAQLLAESKHLKQMKDHIDLVESQRKGIYEELGKEKSRSKLLEMQLAENQAELARLVEAKKRLESQIKIDSTVEMADYQLSATNQRDDQGEREQLPENEQYDTIKSTSLTVDAGHPINLIAGHDSIMIPECEPSTSRAHLNNVPTNDEGQTETNIDTSTWSKSSDLDESYNSVEVYRRFINSMSPDMDAIRQERKLIISEFDNLKRILADMEE